jgi:NAD(P)-dependent dehydrogenase (short-subunit alcohol dehydrogenase family)
MHAKARCSYSWEGGQKSWKGVAQECGTDPLIIPTDVSSPSAVDSLMAETVSRYGALHVLLNNAGILHAGTAEQVTPEQWDETFNINVRGVWLLSRAALPHMRAAGGGSIINIASVWESTALV